MNPTQAGMLVVGLIVLLIMVDDYSSILRRKKLKAKRKYTRRK